MAVEVGSPEESSFGDPAVHRRIDVDHVLRALANPVRREVLCLLDVNPQWERTALASEIGTVAALDFEMSKAQAQAALYHVHLPKLEEANLVETDDANRRVEKGPDFDAVQRMVDAAADAL